LRFVRLPWVLLLVCVTVSACSRSGVFRPEYEYEEEIYLALDGSATINVNASVPALVALRGADLDVNPRARLDRERVRALFAAPGADVRVTLSRRDGRRFVHASVDVDDVRQASRLAPLAWSTYRFERRGDVFEYRQQVGAPARRAPIGDVGWTGQELVLFKMHLPAEIVFHNTPDGVLRGNILEWEQPLTERLAGAPLDLQVHVETESILFTTLMLFVATVVAALLAFALAVWWIARRGREGEVAATVCLALALGAVDADAGQQRGGRFQVEEATIEQIQQAIRSRQTTTVGVVELYLRRIKAYNGTCVNEPQGVLGPITTIPRAGQINALSTLNLRPAARKTWGFDDRKARSLTDPVDGSPAMPDALETAAAQDRQFRQTGRLAGPLHGVVMAIKDQYDTFDMRTTSGADAQYANDRPPDDATFVKRLRDAGAIIIAKANLAEYAVDGARSSFGGTFCNPYDTEREPGMSSAGSATAVAANLVTCAIGEETVVSIRWPASVNSLVGLAPTQELVSRDGMMGSGLNMRTGPICRTVQDAAKVLDAIAGYDTKDPMTAQGVGRMPSQPYASFAAGRRLNGLRIGVVREYMNRTLLSKADEESIGIIERAVGDLRALGATVIDPGPEGELFKACIARQAPELLNSTFARQYRQLFPVDAVGQPAGDHIASLLDLQFDPSRVPAEVSLRTIGVPFAAPGEGKYMINRYLRERGDANIRTNADLIARATFYQDPNFPDRRQAREAAEQATVLDTATRLQGRFALQTMLLQCMEEQRLDVLVTPMSTVPPRKLTSPREPVVNGRPPIGWSLIGQQGFPVITVPAGFTTEVWDRVRDGSGTRLEGPVAARLPVGVDFIGRPFGEPLLFRVASAYEAATKHRRPPGDFGPLPGDPRP
jgi:amidase